MTETTPTSINRHSLREPGLIAHEARRLVGLQRHYHCAACRCEWRSWTRLAACPDCGEPFASAVIRRAAFGE
jgi:hypothetical protein